jgi:sensor histidine kinase YesM
MISNQVDKAFEANDSDERIGLRNLQRRLEIMYPEKYKLTTEHKPETNQFVSALWITLKQAKNDNSSDT